MAATLERPTETKVSHWIELFKNYKRAPTVTNSAKSWPVKVKCRVIEPGLVNYDDLGFGTVLVQRPFLNKVAKSFEGKPVIDEVHKNAKPENFQEIADGMVSRIWTDPTDGWDWCEFFVWDEQALAHCHDPSYHVSCAYEPTQVDKSGGKYHNIEYDQEFLDGAYTHLAIVKDPRYEGANIVWNSVGGKQMDLFKIFRSNTSEEVAEVEGDKTFIEVDGKRVSIENAVKMIQAKKADPVGMKDTDSIEIDGKRWTGAEIKNALAANKKAKNEKDDKDEEKHDHKDSENCGKGCPAYNAADDDEKKDEDKGEKAAKNSIKTIAALGLNKDEAIAVINSVSAREEFKDDAKAQEVFEKALNALGAPEEKPGKYMEEFERAVLMNNNAPDVPQISTMHDRIKTGLERYGKELHSSEAK
jgi:hypothetical protein